MEAAGRDCLTCEVREADCFCSLRTEALVELQSVGSFRAFAEGERVFEEGSPADRVYVMCRGRMKLSASSPGGRLLLLRIAGPGDVLGLGAALIGGTYRLTAEALEPCEAKAIPRSALLALMERYRDVGHNTALTLALEGEGAMLSARRLALSGSASGKLASLLLDWAGIGAGMGARVGGGDAGEPIAFRMPLTHEELGNMAGLSRETVTRTLVKFRREGLVVEEGERMTLPDPGAMESRYR